MAASGKNFEVSRALTPESAAEDHTGSLDITTSYYRPSQCVIEWIAATLVALNMMRPWLTVTLIFGTESLRLRAVCVLDLRLDDVACKMVPEYPNTSSPMHHRGERNDINRACWTTIILSGLVPSPHSFFLLLS